MDKRNYEEIDQKILYQQLKAQWMEKYEISEEDFDSDEDMQKLLHSKAWGIAE